MDLIQEGKAKVYVHTGKISKKLPVFYNPVMKHNRDIAILVLNALNRKNMQIALPLAASGVRGVRFGKELRKGIVEKIYINDHSPEAAKLIRKNLALNKVKAEVSQEDATLFLLKSAGFDYIDIDPFGTPNPFLDAAVKRISRTGVLAVTATDTSSLAGTYEKVCMRKYWARPLHNELMHEAGIRILIRKVQMIGSQYEKALVPVFSYFKDHYYRVFFACEKGKKKVDEIIKQWGYFQNAGPMWLGKLWDERLVKKINIAVRDKELKKFIETIKKEAMIDAVGFYDLHTICGKRKITVPRTEEIIEKIRKKGYQAAQTHFCGWGIRSTIPLNEILKII